MVQPQQTLPRPYRLGLALSGGGARGLAHTGALAAIEEAGLRPDVIAGVSAGSVAAVMYAAGNSPRKILEIFDKRGFTDFVELRPRHGGLFSVSGFRKMLELAIGPYKNMEDLPVPVYVGVTDFDNGVAAEFHTGPTVDRVVASCSIPIVFKPMVIDGVRYVDGGVLRNHPAWIVRPLCDVLIGINVSPLRPRSGLNTFMGVAMRTYNLMAKANQRQDMQLCDLSVEMPEIAGCSTFDLSLSENLFMSGYLHTRRALRRAGMWKDTPALPGDDGTSDQSTPDSDLKK